MKQLTATNRAAIAYLKRERMLAEDTISVQRFLIIGLLGIILALIIVFSDELNTTTKQLKATEIESLKLTEEINTLTTSMNELTNNLSIMTQVSIKLEEENNSLISDNRSLAAEWDEIYAELSKMQKRSELYDKYEYVINYGGQRTDIKYSDLKHLEDIAEELGLTQDAIDLTLSFVMCESGGDEKAYNASGASGLGQLMPGTGRYAWNNLMPYSITQGLTYDHSTIPFNGSLNLEMALRYIAHLDNVHGSAVKVVTSYCGGWSEGYVNKLNRYLAKGPSPTTVQTLRIRK